MAKLATVKANVLRDRRQLRTALAAGARQLELVTHPFLWSGGVFSMGSFTVKLFAILETWGNGNFRLSGSKISATSDLSHTIAPSFFHHPVVGLILDERSAFPTVDD